MVTCFTTKFGSVLLKVKAASRALSITGSPLCGKITRSVSALLESGLLESTFGASGFRVTPLTSAARMLGRDAKGGSFSVIDGASEMEEDAVRRAVPRLSAGGPGSFGSGGPGAADWSLDAVRESRAVGEDSTGCDAAARSAGVPTFTWLTFFA